MLELMKYAIIGLITGLLIYETLSSKTKIDKLSKTIQFEQEKLSSISNENASLRLERHKIEIQMQKLEGKMYDREWLEIQWKKTQARKDYKDRLRQIEKMKGE